MQEKMWKSQISVVFFDESSIIKVGTEMFPM